MEGLESGDYILKETEAADGYKIEDTAIEFTIIDGQRTTVEVENTPMSSLFIRKIDSVTKEGIGGVKFLLYDADNDPIGEYESDNEGYVWLDKTLEDGKYKLREIEAAEGYIGDDEVKTFWVKMREAPHIRPKPRKKSLFALSSIEIAIAIPQSSAPKILDFPRFRMQAVFTLLS